jgi:hypothetical protein
MRLRPAHWIAIDAIVAAAYLGLLVGWILPHVPGDRQQHSAGLPGLPGWLDWVAVLLSPS